MGPYHYFFNHSSFTIPITNSSFPFPHMEENPHRRLLQPLLPPPSATASPPIVSNSGILSRLCLVAFIGIVSLWANHEASKGYAITIVNESRNTFHGKRFQLFYVANDEATRTVIEASNIIESFLFPNSVGKKVVKSVALKLVGRDFSDVVETVNDGHGRFVINLSPSIMRGANFRDDVASAIRRGVAKIWLWDGGGDAPKNLIEGIVEYLVNYSDGSFTHLSENSRVVAELLNCGERRRPGFVRRLNYAMKDGWDEERLGGALGLPVQELCGSLRYNLSSV